MQPRTGTREFAIILFCLLGIVALNDFSHNRYQKFTNPWPMIWQAIHGSPAKPGYSAMNLYELLDKWAKDYREVEKLKGVAFYAQIQRETPAAAPEEGRPHDEKVGDKFRVYRTFSETGSSEDAHPVVVDVHFPGTHMLEPGQWVYVQGHAKPAAGGDPDRPQLVIEAISVDPMDTHPMGLLTPKGEQDLPGGGGGDEHSD